MNTYYFLLFLYSLYITYLQPYQKVYLRILFLYRQPLFQLQVPFNTRNGEFVLMLQITRDHNFQLFLKNFYSFHGLHRMAKQMSFPQILGRLDQGQMDDYYKEASFPILIFHSFKRIMSSHCNSFVLLILFLTLIYIIYLHQINHQYYFNLQVQLLAVSVCLKNVKMHQHSLQVPDLH